jgi:hypothetical protein
LDEKANDPYAKEKDYKNERDYRRAQKAVYDSINTDKEYQEFLNKHLGKD